jgi:muconolactone delta-isomerase
VFILEYLVTMTSHVPAGTPDAAVDEVRGREAARSSELAADRSLLRLWRPPLQPGEWRTLGLFAAGDADQLESVLASMPLRVWRTDEVTPLSRHANDPPVTPERDGSEYLTVFTDIIPDGTPAQEVADARAHEAERARALGAQGHLERLWTLPEDGRALGLFQARDAAELQTILASLPLYAWMKIDTTPLSKHPSDPGTHPEGNPR